MVFVLALALKGFTGIAQSVLATGKNINAVKEEVTEKDTKSFAISQYFLYV